MKYTEAEWLSEVNKAIDALGKIVDADNLDNLDNRMAVFEARNHLDMAEAIQTKLVDKPKQFR